MALLTRFSFICSHNCKNILFSSVARVSIRRFNHRIFSTLKFTQTLPSLQSRITGNQCLQVRYQSTNEESKKSVRKTVIAEVAAGNKLSQRARLKQAVRDYGATIIVFHVAISLASLGICYAAISNGVDAVSLLSRLGFPESVISSKVAVGGSTFVMSYAVHKLFAPVRIAITLSSAPFIVRYLRKINLIKRPK